MTITQQFRHRVERFIVESGIPATTLGSLALGDPTFVFELRRGRSCRAYTMDRVIAFIDAYEASESEDVVN